MTCIISRGHTNVRQTFIYPVNPPSCAKVAKIDFFSAPLASGQDPIFSSFLIAIACVDVHFYHARASDAAIVYRWLASANTAAGRNGPIKRQIMNSAINGMHPKPKNTGVYE
jgi:hypothetical protein